MSRPYSAVKPRIRLLHIASGDLWAGAETQIFQLARALNTAPAVSLKIAVMNPGTLASRLTEEGIEVLTLDESRQSFVELLRALTRLNRTWKPHIVHTHRQKEHLLGALSSRASGATLVATIHGATEFTYPWWDLRHQILLRIERAVLAQYFRNIVAVSVELANLLRSRYSHVTTIVNGVDPESIREAARAYAPPVDDNRTRLAFIGRLVPVKRVDRILAAMGVLHGAEPERWALYIIGDGPLARELQQAAERLSAKKHIHFIGHLDNPIPWLARMDVLILASDHEGLPMTALEALALNVPFVAPFTGGLTQLAERAGIGGLLFRTDSDLKNVLQHRIGQPNTHANAGARLPAEYHVTAVAKQYLALYEGVLRHDIRHKRRT